MKQLTDAERLEIAMSLLSDYEIGVYANICKKNVNSVVLMVFVKHVCRLNVLIQTQMN